MVYFRPVAHNSVCNSESPRKHLLNYSCLPVVKKLPAHTGCIRYVGSISGLEWSPGEGNVSPLIFAWRIPWTEKPGGLQSIGLQSQTQLSDWTWTRLIEQVQGEKSGETGEVDYLIPSSNLKARFKTESFPYFCLPIVLHLNFQGSQLRIWDV